MIRVLPADKESITGTRWSAAEPAEEEQCTGAIRRAVAADIRNNVCPVGAHMTWIAGDSCIYTGSSQQYKIPSCRVHACMR